ncbi:hypothetical protein [Prevotella jejuni]|nr:hypothetical protein [Prevotella jejuni]
MDETPWVQWMIQDELIDGAGWVRGRNTMGSVDVQDELVDGAE